MNIALTVIVAVLTFGVLIFIHELGHFLFARLFGVTVKEFSIGVGPKLLQYTSKKTGTVFSLAALPLGGYVSMAGEDEESDDPNSFDKKPAWQRLVITAAGAAVHLVAGLLALTVWVAGTPLASTTVADFPGEEVTGYTVSSADSGLSSGDTILRVNGRKVRSYDAMSYEIMRFGYQPVTLTVLRGGEEVTLENVVFPTTEGSGQIFGAVDFRVYREDKTFTKVVGTVFSTGALLVRMCWESLFDLIVGRYTFAAFSGPVGISGVIGEAVGLGFLPFIYILAVIAINLGIMNLLPIPALDGGRIFLLLVEMITKKRLPKKIEGAVNTVFLFILFTFSLVIMVKDVIGLF